MPRICRLCDEVKDQILVLPCHDQHKACKECLQRQLLEMGHAIKCHECRAIHGAIDFDLLKVEDGEVGGRQVCSLCEESADQHHVPASRYCLNCSNNLCEDCFKMHERLFRGTKSHNTVSFDEFRQKSDQFTGRYCKEHNSEQLLFCLKCQNVGCLHCCASDCSEGHDHNWELIEKESSKLKTKIDSKITDIVTQKICCEEKLKGISIDMEDYRVQTEEACDRLKGELEAKMIPIQKEYESLNESLQGALQEKARQFEAWRRFYIDEECRLQELMDGAQAVRSSYHPARLLEEGSDILNKLGIVSVGENDLDLTPPRFVAAENALGLVVTWDKPKGEPVPTAAAATKDEVDNITQLLNHLKLVHTKENLDDIQKAEGAVADSYYNSKKFEEALEHYKIQYEKRCQMEGEDNISEYRATVLFDMGYCCNELKRHGDAVEFYKDCLDLRLKVFGEDSEKCALCYNNLGFAYNQMARYREAKQNYVKAVEIRRKINTEGFVSANLAGGLSKLGSICSKLSDYETSVKFYTEELEMRRKLYKNNQKHEKIADALFNIGFNSNKTKHYVAALEHYLESYEIYKEVWKDNPVHNDLDVGLYNLGCTYENLRQYEEAVYYFKRNATLRVRRYNSTTHAKVKNAYRAIANVLEKMPEKKEESAEWRKKCS